MRDNRFISRRGFLEGVALSGAGMAIAGLAGCTSSNTDGNGAATQAESLTPVSTETCDVVVVGSGTAGTCASVRAAQMGAKVICVEKNDYLGGTSRFGEGLCAVGTSVQKEQGVVTEVEDYFNRAEEYHHWAADANILHEFYEESGATIEWLISCGIRFGKLIVPEWHMPVDSTGAMTKVGTGLLAPMQSLGESLGVDYRTSTPMKELVTKNGAVTGVIVVNSDGDAIEIDAPSVILATGGYADSKDLFEEFTGFEFDRFHPWGAEGRDGDGIRLARDLGAALHCPGAAQFNFGRLMETKEFDEEANFWLTFKPVLRVNESAKRFSRETLVNINDFTGIANALLAQSSVYAIVDDAFVEAADEMGPVQYLTGVTKGDARASITNCGGITKADTLEELADALGLDPEALVETVNTYNSYADAGVDPEFGTTDFFPIKTAPFYGGYIQPTYFCTVGGLRINTNLQVLDADGAPIPGLHAIGGDANGIYGDNYDVKVGTGSQQGWAATSGRLVAEYVCAQS